MKLLIIGQGPSAGGEQATRTAELYSKMGFKIAGVNGIVERFNCDYWVFGDVTAYLKSREHVKPSPSGFLPTIFTRRIVATDHVRTHQREWWPGWPCIWHEMITPDLTPERLRQPDPRMEISKQNLPRWNLWSGCAAFGLAAFLRAERIMTMGIDMAGADDFAGNENKVDRSEHRWQIEREIVGAWVGYFNGRGVQVQSATNG